MQDLLIYVTKGLSAVTTELRKEGKEIQDEIDHLVVMNLFTTITNVNFDRESITERITETLDIKEKLLTETANREQLPQAAVWNGTETEFDKKAAEVGILSTENEDIRSLRELITYGLKGLVRLLTSMRLRCCRNDPRNWMPSCSGHLPQRWTIHSQPKTWYSPHAGNRQVRRSGAWLCSIRQIQKLMEIRRSPK